MINIYCSLPTPLEGPRPTPYSSTDTNNMSQSGNMDSFWAEKPSRPNCPIEPHSHKLTEETMQIVRDYLDQYPSGTF